MTTFTFRLNAGRLAVPGARIRFAGHSARTDASGHATIRTRLKRRGLRRAVAWKGTYRSGSTRVRVV
jgi:N-dimethylarginine dimethylaminohydrolase